MKLLDQRPAQPVPGRLAFLRSQPVDPALDVEDRVDPGHGLQRHGRDVMRGFAPPPTPLDVGELEELASGMAPEKRTLDRPRISLPRKSPARAAGLREVWRVTGLDPAG